MNRYSLPILLAVFLLLIPCHSNAQMELGLKAGANFSKGSKSKYLLPQKTLIAADEAIVLNIPTGGIFYLHTGLERAAMGTRSVQFTQLKTTDVDVSATAPGQEYIYATVSYASISSYILLPINAGITFDINKLFSIYVEGGPYIGYLAGAHQHITTNGTYYADDSRQTVVLQNYPIDERVNTMDFYGTRTILGFNGQVGLKYYLKHINLFAEAGGNYIVGQLGNKGNIDASIGAFTCRLGAAVSFQKVKKEKL